MGNRLLKLSLLMAIALLLVCVIFCGCPSDSIESRAAARVGDQKISVTDLALRLRQIPDLRFSPSDKQKDIAQLVLESIVDEKILSLEAKKRAISVSAAAVEHEVRQQEAMLGQASFAYFLKKNLLNKQRLSAQVEQQLEALEYLRLIQIEEKPFCDVVLGVQSSQNCTKRSDFLARVRKKYPIVVNQDSIPLALLAISGAE